MSEERLPKDDPALKRRIQRWRKDMTKSIKVYGGELHVPLKVDDQMKRFIKEHERMAAIYKAAKLNGWI